MRELINQRLGLRTVNDFLHQRRLREATERLSREDVPILTIALECGYGSIGPFNRAFKQCLGVTPTGFRAGARQAQAGSGSSNAIPHRSASPDSTADPGLVGFTGSRSSQPQADAAIVGGGQRPYEVRSSGSKN